jgi:amidohydrolase
MAQSQTVEINDFSLADIAALTALRRDIHAEPEVAFEERRTSDLIAKAMTDWGIPVHRGVGETGVIGVIQNGDGERAIGLRADIDALEISEVNAFAHASRRLGKMHACGHDGHTAMLLAAAKRLSSHRKFDGTVYLIFQPAEENGGGAKALIDEGLFERFPMEAIFGVHNWPGIPVGKFAIRSGPVFASTNDFRVVVHGKGAHAAMPDRGTDPILIACHLVQAFQTIITRNKRPIDTGLISVSMLHAGEATNVMPNSCEIRGTVRAFSTEIVDMIEHRMRKIVESICEAFDAKFEFDFLRKYPPTVNHLEPTNFAHGALSNFAGRENILNFEPTMAAEDFSFYLLEKPGCYFLIGNGDGSHRLPNHGQGDCVLHNSSYDFNDDLIPLGGAMWVHLVEEWFAGDPARRAHPGSDHPE